ncbi:hypothetical protein ACAW74_02755 [Fibrella sp. WM1]|uniref:hypothetical protein n=1 Tax=Fibrella musci TaxID=3242485 RepID=UPI0035222BD5
MRPKVAPIFGKNWVEFLKLAIGFFLLAWIPVDCARTTYKSYIQSTLDERPTKYARAIIIEKKHFLGNGPVSHEFRHYYSFYVNNIEYEGVIRNSFLNIGDSITIKYLISDPTINTEPK